MSSIIRARNGDMVVSFRWWSAEQSPARRHQQNTPIRHHPDFTTPALGDSRSVQLQSNYSPQHQISQYYIRKGLPKCVNRGLYPGHRCSLFATDFCGKSWLRRSIELKSTPPILARKTAELLGFKAAPPSLTGQQWISVRLAALAKTGCFGPRKYTTNGVGMRHCAETPWARFSAHMLVGYMRVSTSGDRQFLDLQRDALLAAGVDERHLFEDRVTGS